MKAVAGKQQAPGPPAKKRYRLLMNDAVNTATMMLAADGGEIEILADGSIVSIKDIILNEVGGRRWAAAPVRGLGGLACSRQACMKRYICAVSSDLDEMWGAWLHSATHCIPMQSSAVSQCTQLN